MASRSLGNNAYYNRLYVNRLEALSLKAESTKESTEKPSYLFSLDIKEGKFDNNTLTFYNSDYELLTFHYLRIKYRIMIKSYNNTKDFVSMHIIPFPGWYKIYYI